MLSAVRVIAEKIVDEKKKNAGRAPWGFALRLLKQGKETFPNMSMRPINNYVIKIGKRCKENNSKALYFTRK